jgi:hypothetical protein
LIIETVENHNNVIYKISTIRLVSNIQLQLCKVCIMTMAVRRSVVCVYVCVGVCVDLRRKNYMAKTGPGVLTSCYWYLTTLEMKTK